MSGYTVAQSMPSHCRMAATLASMAAAMMLGACAQSGENLTSMLGSPAAEKQVAEADAGGGKSSDNRTELEKATEYWGKKYKEKPSDKEAGLSYAKNLRAMGEKRQALAVMQQLAMFYGHDKDVASEYGRLALEMDQIGIAKQMLAVADDPGKPDWRVISAKGTILAKEGKFTDAIPLFERAMTLAPDQTSVMNNLAMAYAMGGEAARAEEMLRRIEQTGGTANPKIRQNLALVLGLQGKFDESKAIASEEIGREGAAANASLLRQFVKSSQGAAKATQGPAVAGWSATAGDPKSNANARRAPADEAGGEHQITDTAPVAATEPPSPASRLGGADAPLLRGMTR